MSPLRSFNGFVFWVFFLDWINLQVSGYLLANGTYCKCAAYGTPRLILVYGIFFLTICGNLSQLLNLPCQKISKVFL